MRPILRRSTAILLGLATIYVLRMGYSDYLFQKDTRDSVQRASELWPRNAFYQARLADLDPSNQAPHLERASALNPGLAQVWIKLGLQAELAGNYEAAERLYLEAGRRDHQFLPAWTLAGFYSRRVDEARFWPWARRAADMSYSDIRPLLGLAFGFTGDAAVVLEKMIVPRRLIERQFLVYLLTEQLDASAIAARIALRPEKDDVAGLLAWMDRLLEAGKMREARLLWDGLAARRLVPESRAGMLTNADFGVEPLQRGFDWRTTPPPGVTIMPAGGAIRTEFSGNQPESFDLACQSLDLAPGQRYSLSLEYRTADIDGWTNLLWKAGASKSPPLAAEEKWTAWEWTFVAGATNRIVLAVQHAIGTTRPAGIVYMRGLRLSALPLPKGPAN